MHSNYLTHNYRPDNNLKNYVTFLGHYQQHLDCVWKCTWQSNIYKCSTSTICHSRQEELFAVHPQQVITLYIFEHPRVA